MVSYLRRLRLVAFTTRHPVDAGAGHRAVEEDDQSALSPSDRELLLKAYELERLDDIQAASTFLTLLAPIIGLLSLIGFALINAVSLPKWLIALVPLAPLPFAAYAALYTHLAQVRGLMLDHYECELRRHSGVIVAGLRVPFGHRVLGRIWVSAYARVVIAISALALGAMYVAIVVVAFRDARYDEPYLAYFGVVFASIATVVIVALFVIALRPEREFRRRALDV